MVDHRINAEVLAISGAGAYLELSARYEGTLHTKKSDLWLQTIVSVDVLRDYNGNLSDYVTISFLMPLGDFVKVVYPNKDYLEITLINYTVGKKITTRYKLLLTNIDPNIKAGAYNKKTIQELNKEGMTSVNGQCLSLTIEELRDKIVFGSYKKATVNDVLSVLLTEAMLSVNTFDFSTFRNVDMVPVNNNRVYDYILIPDTVHAIDLPSFLQHGSYGVYNGGIGTYLQVVDDKETLFVYPLYRKDMLSHSKNKLQITAVASVDLASLDSTYAMDGSVLKILVSSLNKHDDKGEADLKSKGSGVVVTDSEAIMTRPVEITEDEVKVKKDSIKRVYVHKDTEDKILKKEQHGLTNNTYDARSSVLKSDGRVIQVQWNMSNARMLTPAMGLTYMIEEEDGIKIYDGILQGVHIVTDNNTKMEAAVLNIFIDLKPSTNSILGGSVASGLIAKVSKLV